MGKETGERKRRWKEDRAEPHGPEKPQVARALIAGEYSSVAVNLPDLGVQFTNETKQNKTTTTTTTKSSPFLPSTFIN